MLTSELNYAMKDSSVNDTNFFFVLGPKYSGRAIAQRELDTRYSNTKKKIVLIHNFYRAKVEPPAGNMLEMVISYHFEIKFIHNEILL